MWWRDCWLPRKVRAVDAWRLMERARVECGGVPGGGVGTLGQRQSIWVLQHKCGAAATWFKPCRPVHLCLWAGSGFASWRSLLSALGDRIVDELDSASLYRSAWVEGRQCLTTCAPVELPLASLAALRLPAPALCSHPSLLCPAAPQRCAAG